MLFHYFDHFLAEYDSRFEKEYCFLRPIIKDVVDRYLDCGNPRCGFPRIRCPEWTKRLLSWRHTGFSFHSRVWSKTKSEAERLGQYMIRLLLSLKRLSLDERTGRVGYRHGKEAKEVE